MPSINIGGSQTSALTAVVSTSAIPAGGGLVTIYANETYVVPAGHVLKLTAAHAAYYDGASQYRATRVLVNGDPIAYCGPTSPVAGTTVSLSPTTAVDLVFKAGETLTVTTEAQNSTWAVAWTPYTSQSGNVSGTLIPSADSSNADSPAHAEPYPTRWGASQLLGVSLSSVVPVRAVPLGDGLALLIRNNQIDAETTLLNIETGVETAVYTGTEKLNISNLWHLMGAYDANYKSSGKSLVRLMLGNSDELGFGSATFYLLELRNGALDTDFRVRPLQALVYSPVGGRTLVAGRKPLGFAGIDYIIAMNVTATAQQRGGTTTFTDLQAIKIDVAVPVVTTITIPSGLPVSFNSNARQNTTSFGWGDYYVRARAVRGNAGRLYVHMHSLLTASNSYEEVVATISATGTLLSSLKTTHATPAIMATPVSASFVAMGPMTFGVTVEANGSERAVAVGAGMDLYDTVNQMELRQTLYSFSAGGLPAGVGGFINQVFGAAAAFATRLPADTVVAPSGNTLGSYFENEPWDEAHRWLTTPQRTALQATPGQDRRTNGLIHGHSAGWYYPNGVWVEQRSRGDFGTLVKCIDTTVPNPVQAITSATKLLIVGVNGQWEVLTP